jgi:hypothetical protein
MSELPPYRRTYEDSRLNEAYHLYVDGKGSHREIEAFSGISKRTISRYSASDKWAPERDERMRIIAHESALASINESLVPAGATNTEPDLDVRIAAALRSPEVLQRHGGVASQQRALWDALMTDLREAYAEFKARLSGKPASVGQLFPYVMLGEKISVCQRKAHGMADVTKLEIDDKSAAARRHAETIRKKKEERSRALLTTTSTDAREEHAN